MDMCQPGVDPGMGGLDAAIEKVVAVTARSSLTWTRGQAVNKILKFWPLFCIKFDKRLSATSPHDPHRVPGPCWGSHWQILDPPLMITVFVLQSC